MTIALIFLAQFALLMLGTLILFATVTRLEQLADAGKLTPALKVFAYGLILPVGYLSDFLLNVEMSLVFLWPPQDLLLTGRLIRYKRAGSGWRFRLASLICEQLLDPLDPSGCHCKT